MATNKTNMKPASAEEITNEKKFPLNVLKANCTKLFGVTSSTFAGATTDVSDGEYTIAYINNKVKNWLKKEVQ